MRYSLLTIRMFFISGFFVGCGPLDHNNEQPSDLQKDHAAFNLKNGEVHDKWLALVDYLKLPDHQTSLNDEARMALLGSGNTERQKAETANRQIKSEMVTKLSQPTGLFAVNEMQNYVQVLEDVTATFTANAHATRCAEIVSFERLPINPYYNDLPEDSEPRADLPLRDRNKKLINSSAYMLKYRAQRNERGAPESAIRAGIVIVPNKAPTNPSVIFYAHGNDAGLAYREIASVVGRLQEEAIVIAPAYPGEPICKASIAQRTMQTRKVDLSCDAEGAFFSSQLPSIPWQNDAEDFLVMVDAFSRTLLLDPAIKADLIAKGLPFSQFGLKENEATKAFYEAIAPITGGRITGYYGTESGKPLKSAIIGTSRGGLVGALALARSGAAWWSFSGILFENGMDAVQSSIAAAPVFGKGMGLVPPMFDSIAAIAAPSTVMMGQLKIILEQMVKGHGNTSLAAYLPGLQQLVDRDIFKEFREAPLTEESVKKAAFEVISRDLPLLAPLAFAALKESTTKGAPGTIPGSMLLMHNKDDRVVPYEQTRIAFNALTMHAANKKVRQMIGTRTGPKVQVEILEYRKDLHLLANKNPSYHVDEAFWFSKSIHPLKFVQSTTRLTYFNVNSEEAMLGKIQQIIAASNEKFSHNPKLLADEFHPKTLANLWSYLEKEPKELNLTEAQKQVLDHLVTGSSISPLGPQKLLSGWLKQVLN